MRYSALLILCFCAVCVKGQTLQDLVVLAKKAKAGRVIDVMVSADAHGFLFDIESTDEEFFLGREDIDEVLAFRKSNIGYMTIFSTANKTLADSYLKELGNYPESKDIESNSTKYKAEGYSCYASVDTESASTYYIFLFEID